MSQYSSTESDVAAHDAGWPPCHGGSVGEGGGMNKKCTKCGHEKQIDFGFHKSSKSADGHASWCKTCTNAIRRESRVRTYTPANRRKWALKSRYGIQQSDVDQMLKDQQGACAICAASLQKFHIDHDHQTGKVRGLLCHRCNVRLGVFDDPEWREAATNYLGAAK